MSATTPDGRVSDRGEQWSVDFCAYGAAPSVTADAVLAAAALLEAVDDPQRHEAMQALTAPREMAAGLVVCALLALRWPVPVPGSPLERFEAAREGVVRHDSHTSADLICLTAIGTARDAPVRTWILAGLLAGQPALTMALQDMARTVVSCIALAGGDVDAFFSALRHACVAAIVAAS